MFLIVLFLTKLTKNRSSYLHYGLWSLILLRLILPTDLSLSFSARTLFDNINIYDAENTERTLKVNQEKQNSTLSKMNPLENTNQAESTLPVTTSLNTNGVGIGEYLSWNIFLFLIWALGTLVFSIILLRRYIYYRQAVKNSKPIANAQLSKYLKYWLHRFRIKRKVRLVSSNACISPFTIGAIHPVIFLPEDLLNMRSKTIIESVIAHELAHIKNFDDLWIKAQNLIQLIYFYHPIVWLTCSRLNQVRERICDELVLSKGTISPKTYGNSMLTVLKMNLLGIEGVEMMPSFGNHKKKFLSRIHEITNVRPFKKSNTILTGFILTVLAIFLLPMGASTSKVMSESDLVQTVQLHRHLHTQGDYAISALTAGSSFQKVEMSNSDALFCPNSMPPNLKNMEYAAIGIFDSDYKKYWLLKGERKNGEIEFFFDTDGDNDYSDESALKIRKKTAKYHYEDSPEWISTNYWKTRIEVDYTFDFRGHQKTAKFSVYLIYHPELNFLEFTHNEIWVGEATFGDKKYKIALYGGLRSGWYLQTTFDKKPQPKSINEIRIDFNQNKVFEELTVFVPAANKVVREKYSINEPILVDGRYFEIQTIQMLGEIIEIQIAPKFEKQAVTVKASNSEDSFK